MQASQVVRYEEVRNRMGILLAQEEAFWKQRAKVIWLKDGDTKSKFFHATASSKRRRNLVTKLKRDDGVKVTGQQELCGVASSYFTHLFANNQNTLAADMEYMHPTLTDEDNGTLLAPFQISEFKKALFSMHSDKSPGPDGLNPAFYKRFWRLCGVELFNAGVEWLNNGMFPSQVVDRVSGDWMRMWNLHIPQRIKVFLWRVLRGVLPTRMRLQDRGSLVRIAAPIVRPIMRMIGTFSSDV